MAGITGAGSVRSFANIVGRRIPIIGKGIKVCHFDAGLGKRIAYGRNKPQRGQRFPVPRIQTKEHLWIGFGASPEMALLALAIICTGMAAVACHLAFMCAVSDLVHGLGFVAQLVAVPAGRSVFDVLLGCVSGTVPVQFSLRMAVHTQHALLVMGVRRTIVFTCVFGVDAAAVAKGACFALILLYEFMLCHKPNADASHRSAFYMAITAGGVATPARFFKHLFVKGF